MRGVPITDPSKDQTETGADTLRAASFLEAYRRVNPPSMKLRIAIDMDEVLADTLAKELTLYNRDHGTNVSKEDLAGFSLYEKVREDHRETVQGYPNTKDFFRDIPVMAGSREVLPELVKRHEVFITTAAMDHPTSFTAKYEWLKEHFPYLPDSHIVFCGDKGILAADFLIDDNAYNFRRFIGKGLLYSAPHNALKTGFERVDSWAQIAGRFLA